MMDSRLSHFLPGAAARGDAGAGKIADPHAADLFSRAMQQSFLLPASVYFLGLVAVLLYEPPKHHGFGGAPAPAAAAE
jgi:hypothetical protein